MGEKVGKEPQKDRIGYALESLDKLTDRSQKIMGLLLNGSVELKDTAVPPLAPENSVIFNSLWQELPDRILKRVNTLDSVFSELENMILH